VAGLPERSLLDAGRLPVEELAAFAARESRRPREIYLAHRWFARRFGTVFRGLLVAASTPVSREFWAGYYNEADLTDIHVLDPFVGGGTSIVEAQRLGATVTGVDVDQVACAITRFEIGAADTPPLDEAATRLALQVGEQLAPFYRTRAPTGEELIVLHYFWVQVVACSGCGLQVAVHPHYRLAYDAQGTRQWVFCRACGQVTERNRSARTFTCGSCRTHTVIDGGSVRYGRLLCPHCSTSQRLIEVGRSTGRPPAWRLFAVEAIPAPPDGRPMPLSARQFFAATDVDLRAYAQASAALLQRRSRDGQLAWLPTAEIPRSGRADTRLIDYGYRRYTDLFNDRQLLHLSMLAEAIDQLEGPARWLCALAFSSHLTTNCMQTAYAFGWRRLTPLFSVRAFRHIPRPVELNPWLAGTGRGTYPNALRRVQQATAFARRPKEFTASGFRPLPSRPPAARPQVLHADARQLAMMPDASVDLVLTDPPYFDNIVYSELSDFFAPWLTMLGVIDASGPVARIESLSAASRETQSVERFATNLGGCFAEVERVLRPDGRLVFTFQHSTHDAWWALARAVASTLLEPVQVLPLLGDGTVGLHVHDGASTWDAVFVFRRGSQQNDVHRLQLSGSGHVRAALAHAQAWEQRLQERLPGRFTRADQVNFRRACLVAAGLGFLRPSADSPIPLVEALASVEAPAAASAS
jgi:SAM-dependent methyltransferase